MRSICLKCAAIIGLVVGYSYMDPKTRKRGRLRVLFSMSLILAENKARRLGMATFMITTLAGKVLAPHYNQTTPRFSTYTFKLATTQSIH